MTMDDNSDYFLLTQKFFSGQFKEVIELNSDFASDDSTYLEYYFRSKISLGLYDEVLNELESKDDILSQTFQHFTVALKGNEESEEFDQWILTNLQDKLVLKIGSIYLTKFGKIEQAILNLENSNSTDLETLSILILLRLYSNNLTKLVEELTILRKIGNDSIIYNLIESFVNSITGSYQSSFYFFEEIEQQFPNFQNQLQLLCLNLQLLQIPESQELLNQIDPEQDSNGDLILNQITFNILNNTKLENDDLIKQLSLKNPEHVFLKDHEEKSQLFDEIVNKYKQ